MVELTRSTALAPSVLPRCVTCVREFTMLYLVKWRFLGQEHVHESKPFNIP